uniref:Uncharacterized protein n=1 Tax=Arundo donax TaxID=35708 RepID=A0A0A9HRT5_ARUDO
MYLLMLLSWFYDEDKNMKSILMPCLEHLVHLHHYVSLFPSIYVNSL